MGLLTYLALLVILFSGCVVFAVWFVLFMPHSFHGRTVQLGGTVLGKIWRWLWGEFSLEGALRLIREVGPLTTHLERNVVVHFPNGSPRAPIHDGFFHVHLFSTPVKSTFRIVPERYQGAASASGVGFSPSGLGIPVTEPNSVMEVAELVEGDNLYVLENPLSSTSALALLAVVFSNVTSLLGLTLAEWQVREKAARAERRHTGADKFRQTLKEVFTRSVAESEVRLSKVRARKLSLEREITETSGSIRTNHAHLDVLTSMRREARGRYQKELDSISEIPEVTSASFEDGAITIVTKTLSRKNPVTNEAHEVGDFRILLYINGENGGIRWYNTVRQVDGVYLKMQAPNVRNSGDAVIGPTQQMFPELLGRGEFAKVAKLAIAYIQRGSPTEPGADTINRWPLAGKI